VVIIKDSVSCAFQILKLFHCKYNTWVLFSALLILLKEKERLKQEKRDEKRLNKERKLEQRRLELEMAKELKKPNEDMCLADQKVIFSCLFFLYFAIVAITFFLAATPKAFKFWSR